jgi:hypothetical protein
VDVDLTLLTGFEKEEEFVSNLTAKFRTRRPDATEFALKNRVLLLRASNDVFLDVALAGLPFEERTVERASAWEISAHSNLITCSAEDLVVHKVFANRDLDWLDVKGVLQRQGALLNVDLIFQELRPLLKLKEAPEIEDRIRKLIDQERLGS